MDRRQKIWILVLSAVAIGAMILLSASLSDLELQYRGQGLPRRFGEEDESIGAPSAGPTISFVFRLIFLAAGALLPFAIIYYIISPEARKRVLRDLLAILIALLPLYLYLLWRTRIGVSGVGDPLQWLEGSAEKISPSPDLEFTPTPSRWLALVATVALALLIAAVLVGVVWYLWRRRRPRAPLEQLAEEAQDAIDAIGEGADLRDTVTRCYFQMLHTLRNQRGIRRGRAVTPREFESSLKEAGVPRVHIRRLTRLFERVRYGDEDLAAGEERQAVVSLTAIVNYCRRGS